MKAHSLRVVDKHNLIHLQSWANQAVQATDKSGKRSKYKKFEDFYDYKKAVQEIMGDKTSNNDNSNDKQKELMLLIKKANMNKKEDE
ncbi:hypothetical protein MHY86_08835 [Aerococcus urinaeequi]|uniref:hypothetical protein n=1 Tax=Aerococcus urinaeequi TaxID=51665 RepID=UPI0022810277|nr:hypothetical protein [Aerococcus urinaeequi]MCY7731804.1 hypothetical protein [Aerococcus urinaeequi]